MYCQNCGKELADIATFCTSCGWKTEAWNSFIEKEKKKRSRLWVTLLGLLLVYLLVFILIINLNG